MSDYEKWWENNVVTGKYWSIDQFRTVLGTKNSRRVYLDLVKEGESVLDVGCGPGLDYEFYLKNNVAVRYVGIDISSGLVGHGKKKHPSASFVCGRSYKLPFKDKAFDTATTRHVLEHLKEPYTTISEMCRVANNVVIIWFRGPKEPEKIRLTRKGFYKNIYSESKLMKHIKSLGFNVTVSDIPIPKVRNNILWFLKSSI